MDPGYRSPLVDLFLRGEAARDVRLLAARGLLPRPAQEQVALLIVLVDDPDPEISEHARATMNQLPREALADFLLAMPHRTPARFLTAAVPGLLTRQIGRVRAARFTLRRRRRRVGRGVRGRTDGVRGRSRLVSIADRRDGLAGDQGTREQRSQLVRDSNQMSQQPVLTSPKLTESEVEAFTKMGNVGPRDVRLRIIKYEPRLAQELQDRTSQMHQNLKTPAHDLYAIDAPTHQRRHQDAHTTDRKCLGAATWCPKGPDEGVKHG